MPTHHEPEHERRQHRMAVGRVRNQHQRGQTREHQHGLNAGVIGRAQFSLLVTVVVPSAIVPTAIAQR